MSRKRITQPGLSDNHFMSVVMAPTRTGVEFHETNEEALEHAKMNLQPSTSVYVAQVLLQGEHAVKGKARHYAVVFELDKDDLAAIRRFNGATKPEAISDTLHALLRVRIDELRRQLQPPADAARGHDDETVCGPLETALLAKAGEGGGHRG